MQSGRVERLDRCMDFILLFLSVISAVIFQFVTSLPYEEQQEYAMHFYYRFSLRLLFLPWIVLVPSWLIVYLLPDENKRMLWRSFVWSFASIAMALNVIVLLVLSFPPETKGLPIHHIFLVFFVLALAFFLYQKIIRAYVRALRRRTLERFLSKRWISLRTLAFLIPIALWLIIIMTSVIMTSVL